MTLKPREVLHKVSVPLEIVLVALLAALYSIRIWYTLKTQSLYFDDAFTLTISSLDYSEILSAALTDTHPPLYMWLLHGWQQVFGKSLTAAVALNLTLSAINLCLLYFTVRKMFSNSAALVALALVSTNALFIYHASNTRMFQLGLTWTLASFALLIYILNASTSNAGRWFGSVVMGVVMALGMLTFYGLGLVFLAEWLIWIGWSIQHSEKIFSPSLLRASLIALLLFLPWLIFAQPWQIWSQIDKQVDWVEPLRTSEILTNLANGLFTNFPFTSTLYDWHLVLALVFVAGFVLLVLQYWLRKASYKSKMASSPVSDASTTSNVRRSSIRWPLSNGCASLSGLALIPVLLLILHGVIFYPKSLFVTRYLFASIIFFLVLVSVLTVSALTSRRVFGSICAIIVLAVLLLLNQNWNIQGGVRFNYDVSGAFQQLPAIEREMELSADTWILTAPSAKTLDLNCTLAYGLSLGNPNIRYLQGSDAGACASISNLQVSKSELLQQKSFLVLGLPNQEHHILQDFQSQLGVELRLVGNREVGGEGSLEGVELYEIGVD